MSSSCSSGTWQDTRPIRSASSAVTSRPVSMISKARDVTAEEAERIGLVSCQVPEEQLLDTCYAIAAIRAAMA
ncbi:hypothetical protein MAHJHV55_54800 [Mycobacterium avium subsp. hominissuis]